MNISFPSDDQAAHEPSEISYVSPVLGNGCRKIREGPEPSRVEYSIHRPSREKLPSGEPDDTTPPKGGYSTKRIPRILLPASTIK